MRQLWLQFRVILIQSTAVQIPYRSPQTVFFVEVSNHNISSSPSATVYVLCGSIIVKCLQYIFFFVLQTYVLIPPYVSPSLLNVF
jgi:hypothetical protein